MAKHVHIHCEECKFRERCSYLNGFDAIRCPLVNHSRARRHKPQIIPRKQREQRLPRSY